MISENRGYTLSYHPDPKKILSGMREKQNILAQELYNGCMPQSVAHAYEVAWRDACLYCLQEIEDTAAVVKHEKMEWQKPAMSYLNRVYQEIMLDNALSPYINYQD